MGSSGITTHVPVTVAPQKQEEPVSTRIPGSERRTLLLRLDLETAKLEELTARQKTALEQEVSYRELGLDPWTDPNPWQRLTREQQLPSTRLTSRSATMCRSLRARCS